MSYHSCAIVNPVAGGKQAKRLWPKLLPRLEEATTNLSVRWTSGPHEATSLTREALREGFDRIIAVGGDGTLHEVVNGFFENETPLRPSAVLAHVACGSGADFRRTLNLPRGVESVNHLHSDRIRDLDLLRIRYHTPDGRREHCYSVNIASFGLSSRVAQLVSRGRSLPIPAFLRYFGGVIAGLTNHRPVSVRLSLDGRSLGTMRVHLVAIANGHTFGDGIPIAPEAVPTDGQFDVTVLHDLPILSLLRHLPKFYLGTHTALDAVETYKGRSLTVHPCQTEPIWVDADGELQGILPATFELVPEAIRVQY